MKAIEQYFHVALLRFLYIYAVQGSSNSIQMKATEQSKCCTVYYALQGGSNPNDSYGAIISCNSVYCNVQSDSNFSQFE